MTHPRFMTVAKRLCGGLLLAALAGNAWAADTADSANLAPGQPAGVKAALTTTDTVAIAGAVVILALGVAMAANNGYTIVTPSTSSP